MTMADKDGQRDLTSYFNLSENNYWLWVAWFDKKSEEQAVRAKQQQSSAPSQARKPARRYSRK